MLTLVHIAAGVNQEFKQVPAFFGVKIHADDSRRRCWAAEPIFIGKPPFRLNRENVESLLRGEVATFIGAFQRR
jgi:hypothetical protein